MRRYTYTVWGRLVPEISEAGMRNPRRERKANLLVQLHTVNIIHLICASQVVALTLLHTYGTAHYLVCVHVCVRAAAACSLRERAPCPTRTSYMFVHSTCSYGAGSSGTVYNMVHSTTCYIVGCTTMNGMYARVALALAASARFKNVAP